MSRTASHPGIRSSAAKSAAAAFAAAAKAAAAKAVAATKDPSTADDSVHVGADGSVTIDAATAHADEEQAVATLRASGRYLVEKITDLGFAQATRQMVVSYETGQLSQMVSSFGTVSDRIIDKAGATQTDPTAATSAPQYKGLPEAATAAADGVTVYPIETHNAHADAQVLQTGGQTLQTLLDLDQTQEQVAQVAITFKNEVERLLRKRGVLPQEGADESSEEGTLWEKLCAASVQGRIALGPKAGWRVTRLGGYPVLLPPGPRHLVADVDGFNVHAHTHVGAGKRDELERLCRYILRPALSGKRLSLTQKGEVIFTLKRPWSDGTRQLLFTPLQFIEKLAVIIPPPRRHLLTY